MRASSLRAPRSLSRWLQSAAVFAVLAGFAALMAVKQAMLHWDLRSEHSARVQALLAAVERPSPEAGQLAAKLSSRGAPLALESRLLPPLVAPRPVRLHRARGRNYLETVAALTLADGSSRTLLIRQDVSARLARERLLELLLVAAAGVSVLITSTLLRLVLKRGLTQPLTAFSHQLAAIRLPPVGQQPLVLAEQPEELRPIAQSFNELLRYIEASWNQQRSFVDGVAHELRTPITLISGYSQSLQRRLAPVAADAPDLAALIERQGQEAERLGVLLGELLTLARSDAGRLDLDLQSLDLDDVLVQAYERLVPLAGGRLHLDPPLSDDLAWVRGDRERLQQCLSNLVLNALRYAPAGSSIELFTSATTELVIAHVRDHGPGVPAGERERIFERFVRGSGSSTASGSGLGLPLVRMLMQAMGGDVQLVDAPGGGAEFQLRLPRCALDLRPAPPRS